MLSDTLENKAKLTSICHYNTHTFKGIVHLKGKFTKRKNILKDVFGF